MKFVIPGEPTGKGRPRVVKRGAFTQTYTPAKTVAYENLVKLEYERQCHGMRYGKEDALGMLITAYKPIPSSVSKKKLRLMLDRLISPGKKPDWDNIGKIICDALNGIVWKDDAQIVDGRVVKLYAEHPRVEVEIWRVGQNG